MKSFDEEKIVRQVTEGFARKRLREMSILKEFIEDSNSLKPILASKITEILESKESILRSFDVRTIYDNEGTKLLFSIQFIFPDFVLMDSSEEDKTS